MKTSYQKSLMFVSLLFLGMVSFGQGVAINVDNSAPNARAILDVKSTTKGLLVPRMSDSQVATFQTLLGASEEGMLVFNSDLNAFFYWNGTIFKAMGAGTLLVDADSDTKINVEESPDEDIIRFDLAGVERWKMTGAKLEAVNSGASVFIGEGAGQSDDLSGNQNTFIGYQTGFANTNGIENTATGYKALHANILGTSNTAIGYFALPSGSAGNSNTAIGARSLWVHSSGGNNTAIGANSLSNNSTGTSNTAVGTSALVGNSTGSNNTAIGASASVGVPNLTYATAIGAGAQVNTSNSLVLGNNANVGIGTSGPVNRLDVRYDGIAQSSTTVLGLISDVSDRPMIQFSEWTEAIPGSGMSIEYNGSGTGSGNKLHIRGVDGLPKFTVESTGDVGLGTIEPNELLEIAGNGRVFIGDGAAAERRGLLIDAVEPGDYVRIVPFDYGTNSSMELYFPSNVNIGAANGATGYKLSVDGNIMAEEVRVQLSGAWPDYVFSKAYALQALPELEKTIMKLGHLPGIPSASSAEQDGIALGEMQRLLLEKIEELTLYTIALDKQIRDLKEENMALYRKLQMMNR
jgi:hypothetical protein